MTNGKRRASIFSKGKTLERFKQQKNKQSVTASPEPEQTFNKAADLNSFKNDIEDYLQGFGGNYKPDFGYTEELFKKQNRWGSVLDYI